MFFISLKFKNEIRGAQRSAFSRAYQEKFWGCTHFIVGRDHAGVGEYYEPYAAQEIFDIFDKKELGVEILKFEEVVFDSKQKKYCFQSECANENKVLFSGTKLRASIKNKDKNFKYLIRPDVYDYLIRSAVSPFIEQ